MYYGHYKTFFNVDIIQQKLCLHQFSSFWRISAGKMRRKLCMGAEEKYPSEILRVVMLGESFTDNHCI